MVDIHVDLEKDIADFLGTESSILYSQDFSTISSCIPAFSKRGDIIVADRAVRFAIQKGLQLSRSTIRFFEHNDLASLEETLRKVNKELERKKGRNGGMGMGRKFIVTEGIFEVDGQMVDLPKIVRTSPPSPSPFSPSPSPSSHLSLLIMVGIGYRSS